MNTQSWLAVVHPEDRQRTAAYSRDHVFRGRQPFASEYRIIRRDDGEERWIQTAGQIVIGPDGRVMEVLSEHNCHGWLEAYNLTGRHGLFATYEAFAMVSASQTIQHGKWLQEAAHLPWRADVPSLNILVSSTAWRNDHNGFSHQDPGFIDHVINKKAEVIRVYLPPDANTLLPREDVYEPLARMISEAVKKAEAAKGQSLNQLREHNAISIDGARGTGKTAVLVNLKSYLNQEQHNSILSKVHILDPVDPTLLENGESLFLHIIVAAVLHDQEVKEAQRKDPNKARSLNQTLEKLTQSLESVETQQDRHGMDKVRAMFAEQAARITGSVGAAAILAVVLMFVLAGAWRRINVYDAFVEGAKEGFGVAVQIIPYLIAMLIAISVFRTTGCMNYVIDAIRAAVVALGLNDEFVPALPVGLMKTLSGSGARGLMVDVMTTYGVDSFPGKLAAIIQGSTETTFYVLAVYFGSVNISKTRYAVACGLIADAAGLVGAITIGYLFYH